MYLVSTRFLFHVIETMALLKTELVALCLLCGWVKPTTCTQIKTLIRHLLPIAGLSLGGCQGDRVHLGEFPLFCSKFLLTCTHITWFLPPQVAYKTRMTRVRVTKERDNRFRAAFFTYAPEARDHQWIRKITDQWMSCIPPPSPEAIRNAPEHYTKEEVECATVLGFCKYIPPPEEEDGWTMIRQTLALPKRDGSWLTKLARLSEFEEEFSAGARPIVFAAWEASPSCNFVLHLPRELMHGRHVDGTNVVAVQCLPGYFGIYGSRSSHASVILGRDNHGNVFPLLDHTLRSRGSEGWDLLDSMEAHFLRGECPWIKTGPGCRRSALTNRSVVCPPRDLHPTFCTNVRIRYRQVEGEFKCYIASFASAVAVAGMLSESRALHEKGCSKPEGARTNDYVHRVIEQHFRGKYEFRRCRKANRFNPFVFSGYLTVVLLKQKQKDAYPHCVTFYKDWIFDSSFPLALTRTRENLDYICGGRGNFIGVKWAKQLLPVLTLEPKAD